MDKNSESFLDDEHTKITLIRLEVEKLKILESELAKKEERRKNKLEAVRN